MLEPVFLKASNLLRSCQTFSLSLMETVQYHAGLSSIVNIIREDTPFLSSFFWLSDGGASSHPNAGTYPARSSACMLISNCSGSPASSSGSASHAAAWPGILLSAITSSGRFFLCFLDVYRTAAGLLHVFGHLPGYFPVRADKVCRMTQLMPLRVPQESRSSRCSLPGCSRVPRPTI